MKKCINCGAELPDEASFCHKCATSQIVRSIPAIPKPRNIKFLRALLALVLAVAVILSLVLIFSHDSEPPAEPTPTPAAEPTPSPTPEANIYDNGSAEMSYTHEGNTYRLAVSFTKRDSIAHCAEGESEEEAVIGAEQNYRTFANFFVLSEDKSAFADNEFSKLVRDVRISATPANGAQALEMSTPAPNPEQPDPFLVSDFYFNVGNGRNDITWEIEMLNGDIIRLHHAFIVRATEQISYSYLTTSMDTIEELQLLVDTVCAEADEDAEVSIFLPPLIYEGELRIPKRSINFIGTFGGENSSVRTTFTGTVTVDGFGPTASSFRNVVFEVPGGIGVFARQSVVLDNCTLRGCETGAYAEEAGWVIAIGCFFEENGIGLDINNYTNARLNNPEYYFNSFTDNGIGFRLSSCTYKSDFRFEDCTFSGNGQDIMNLCANRIDLSSATIS